MDETKPIHSVVLDAGPLLLNQPSISTLLAKSDQIFTTPSVLAEIKDENARQRLETTVKPFLILRNPQPSSVQAVSEFTKKTGDFAVLSRTDLHVFALAYELECERNHGDWRLRSTPGQKKLNGSPPGIIAQKGQSQAEEETAISPSNDLKEKGEPQIHASQDATELGTTQQETDPLEQNVPSEVSNDTSLSQDVGTLSLDDTQHPHPDDNPSPSELHISDNPEAGPSSEPDSDSDGWITPSNLKRHQKRDDKSAVSVDSPQAVLQVATLTTDFALQNSLLLMNLNLLSPSLSRIANLRSHILRCHACFATTKDMTKQFCQRCGMPTMTKVSCSTTSSGGFKLHLKKNMQWNTRGNRYSIPKPVAGTSNGKLGKGGQGKGGKGGWGKELMLAEDQKEYVRAMSGQQRQKQRDLMDEDYLPGILTGDRGSGGRVKVGAGRTVNSRKR